MRDGVAAGSPAIVAERVRRPQQVVGTSAAYNVQYIRVRGRADIQTRSGTERAWDVTCDVLKRLPLIRKRGWGDAVPGPQV